MPQTIESVWADDDGKRGMENGLQSKKSVSKVVKVEKQAFEMPGG